MKKVRRTSNWYRTIGLLASAYGILSAFYNALNRLSNNLFEGRDLVNLAIYLFAIGCFVYSLYLDADIKKEN